VIWNFKYLIAVIPFLALLASTALSILVVFQSSRPNAGLWTQLTVNVTVPYFSISIGLNILMTLAIAGRLVFNTTLMQEMKSDIFVQYALHASPSR
jgi:hypothetical protein